MELQQRNEDWSQVGALLADAAQRLERGGADFVLLGTNTMHKSCAQIEAAIHVPFIHIADATADALVAQGITRVALLGTRYTMEQDFYKQRLLCRGLQVDIPVAEEREMIHRVIFDELCYGRLLPESREAFLRVIRRMADAGAQAAILGCTEIGLLIKPEHSDLPLLDTTVLHAQAAVAFALRD